MALRSPLTVQPYDYIADSNGRPLDYGQVYIGVANQDPEFYQIPVYLDAEMTKPIDQPIRTNDGFVDFAGDLKEIYASEEVYSLKVLDKQGRKVIYKAQMMRDNLTDDALQSLNTAIAESQAQAVVTTTELVTEAIDNVMLGEYQTQLEIKVDDLSDQVDDFSIDIEAQKLDTGITATAKFGSGITRSQDAINAETVSLLDFGAPYSTDSTTHLQKAIDYLDSVGGGKLVIPYHTGVLVISGAITLKPNIEVICDKNLIVDCNAYTSGYQFTLSGDGGTNIPIAANVGTGNTVIQTTTANGFSVGDDVLIVSQRGCAHEDAGELWRLGEATSGTESPFFAEPLIVNEVISNKEFKIKGRLIFPNYRTDKTQETMTTARDSATVQKMDLAAGFSWVGGVFKKESGSTFHFLWCKEPFIDISVIRGRGTGIEVYNRYSLRSNIKVKVTRPTDLVLQSDHSNYNSVKDVSSWYSKVDLDEANGVQGLDQTFSMYCGIYPIYKVRHINPLEDGMTTHGCTYGAEVDVFCTNAPAAAFRNRARFCKGRVAGTGNNWGVVASTYGVLDSDIELDLLNQGSIAVYVLRSGTTTKTPTLKNTTFSGSVVMSPYNERTVIEIQDNEDSANLLKDCQLVFKDLRITSFYLSIKIGQNNHGIIFDNVSIEYYGVGSVISFDASTGHRIGGLSVQYRNSAGTSQAISIVNPITRSSAYGLTGVKINYNTCKFVNCYAINTNTDSTIITRSYSGSTGNIDGYTVNSANLNPFFIFDLLSGGASLNRLILEDTIPMGFEFKFLLKTSVASTVLSFYTTGGGTISFINGITTSGSSSLAATAGAPRLVTVKKIGSNAFIVYE